jgi:hypothetical protein
MSLPGIRLIHFSQYQLSVLVLTDRLQILNFKVRPLNRLKYKTCPPPAPAPATAPQMDQT